MEIEVTYTLEDYHAAMKVVARERKWVQKRKWSSRVASWMIGGAIGLAMVRAVTGPFVSESAWDWGVTCACDVWVVTNVLWLTMLIVWGRRIQRGQVDNTWKLLTNYHGPRMIQIVADGVRIKQEHARDEYAWAAFTKYAESAETTVLYLSDIQFVMVPRRCLDAGQAEELRELCGRFFGEGARGFPVEVGVVAAGAGVGERGPEGHG